METKQCCRYEGKLIQRAFFARSPDDGTVLFHEYLLGSDIVYRSYTVDFATHF